MQQLRDERDRSAAEAESLEARSLEVEVELSTSDESIRLCDGRLARQHEQLVQHEATLTQSRQRSRELEETAARYRQQLAAMTGRVGDVQGRLRETTAALDASEALHCELRDRVAEHERHFSETTQKLDSRRSETETRRADYVERMRQVATLGNRISGLDSQVAAHLANAERVRQRLKELSAALATATRDVDVLATRERELEERVQQAAGLLSANESELVTLRQQMNASREQLVQSQHRLSASRERAAVLQELEENREGLTDGVREVLELAQSATKDWHSEIEGLVADILHVGVDLAPLIDIALSESAQHVVLNGSRLLEELQAGRFRPSGRVGFASANDELVAQDLDSLGWSGTATTKQSQATSRSIVDDPLGYLLSQTDRHPGIIGRADRLIRCDPRFRGLVSRLLADTWLVESLSLAIALHAVAGRSCRFVTATGELVETDGSVIVGPRTPVAGLVSRRNELRELHEYIAELEGEVELAQQHFGQLHELVEQKDRTVKQLQDEHAKCTTEFAGCRLQKQVAQDRVSGMEIQQESLVAELTAAQQQHSTAQQQIDVARGELIALEAAVADAQVAIQAGEKAVEKLETDRDNHSQLALAARVELATAEQQLDTLRARMTQFQEDERERTRAILDARQQFSQASERLLQTDREILRATSFVAELYLAKETSGSERLALLEKRGRLVEERQSWSSQIQIHRKHAHQIDEQLHIKELSSRDLAHRRTTLAERLRDDYKIEISELTKPANAEEQAARENIDQEIADLRRKLSNIGSVNMEALQDLDQLEARYQSLNSQYQDLVQAKESLERIIQKINGDSRRLFQETLEAIRLNFQGLYRRAFGGGSCRYCSGRRRRSARCRRGTDGHATRQTAIQQLAAQRW